MAEGFFENSYTVLADPFQAANLNQRSRLRCELSKNRKHKAHTLKQAKFALCCAPYAFEYMYALQILRTTDWIPCKSDWEVHGPEAMNNVINLLWGLAIPSHWYRRAGACPTLRIS